MEKSDKKTYVSHNVLGQLYKEVKDIEDKSIQAFIRQDYENSILLCYTLGENFINRALAKPEIFSNLATLYSEIVEPMEMRLKKLVIKLGMCTESEMFASNMEFKVFLRQDETSKYNRSSKARINNKEIVKQLKTEL